MLLHDPPWYLYPWYKPWSLDTLARIKELVKSKHYPKIIGTREEKNQYLITLIRTQKALHGWENFLDDTLKSDVIDAKYFITKYPPESISREVPQWAVYQYDKTVSEFIDELATRRVEFVGNDEEMIEFILRFIHSQLRHDWEVAILMIWEMLGDGDTLKLNDLNSEMKKFDYLKIFE